MHQQTILSNYGNTTYYRYFNMIQHIGNQCLSFFHLSQHTPLVHCCVHNMSPFISSNGLSPGSREAQVQWGYATTARSQVQVFLLVASSRVVPVNVTESKCTKNHTKILTDNDLVQRELYKTLLSFLANKAVCRGKAVYVTHAFMMRLVLDATSLPPIFERNDRW